MVVRKSTPSRSADEHDFWRVKSIGCVCGFVEPFSDTCHRRLRLLVANVIKMRFYNPLFSSHLQLVIPFYIYPEQTPPTTAAALTWKESDDTGTAYLPRDSAHGCRTPDVAAMAAFVDDPCHACSTGPDAIVAGRAHADLPDCHDRRLHPPEYLQVGAAVSHSGLGRAGRQTPGGGIRRPAEALLQGSV